MGEQVIVLTDLTKQYGNFTAVDHIRLHIQKGEIFGLLGPNGAGKSTTILMMLGLTEPTSGSVEICGINSTTHPIEVKRKIGYLPEDVGFYDDMTGPENFIIKSYIFRQITYPPFYFNRMSGRIYSTDFNCSRSRLRQP